MAAAVAEPAPVRLPPAGAGAGAGGAGGGAPMPPTHVHGPTETSGSGDVSPLHIPALSPTAYASHMDALTTLARDYEHRGTHFWTIHTCTRGAPPAVPKLREVGSLASWAVTSAKTGNGVDLLRDNNLDTYWQSDGSQPHLIDVTFPHKLALGEVHIYTDYKHDESYTPSRVVVRAGTDANNLREIRVVDLYEPSGWVIIPLKAVAVEAPQQQQEQPSSAAPAQGNAPTSAGATTTTTTSTTTTTEATAMSMDTTDNDISAPERNGPPGPGLLLEPWQSRWNTTKRKGLKTGRTTAFEERTNVITRRLSPLQAAERRLADESCPLRTFCVQLAIVSNHQNGRDTHIRQVKLYGS